MRIGLSCLFAVVSASGFACGSSAPADDTTTPPKTGGNSTLTTISSDQTWSNKTLTGNVVIAAGATVDISPGATITCAKGSTITVNGSLTVSAKSNRAKISCSSWVGLIIANGGSLAAEGLEIENADTAIRTATGNRAATFSYGSVRGTESPFVLEVRSKLSLDHSTFVATGVSEVLGDLQASYIDYTKGAGEGIITGDDNATMTIADSIFQGSGGTGDFLVSQKGKLVKVSYTTVKGAHCAFHFDDVGSFEIDHSTSDENAWAAMLYGSREPSTISASNFVGLSMNIDVQNANGDINIAGTHFESSNTTKNKFAGSTMPRVTNNATAKVSGAAPRGTPGM